MREKRRFEGKKETSSGRDGYREGRRQFKEAEE